MDSKRVLGRKRAYTELPHDPPADDADERNPDAFGHQMTKELLDSITVMPELAPLPDIGKYLKRITRRPVTPDNDAVVVEKLMIKHIEKEKKNLLLTAEKPELTECQRGIDRSEVYYHKRLIQFADALQPNPIPESWIKRITEKSNCKGLKVPASTIDKIKTDYATLVKKMHMDGVFRQISDRDLPYPETSQRVPLTKIVGGKTKNYTKFVKNQNSTLKRLKTIRSPAVVKIQVFVAKHQPHMIVLDPNELRERCHNLNDLMADLMNKLRDREEYMIQRWYDKVMSMAVNRRTVGFMSPNTLSLYIKSVTRVVGAKLGSIVLNSIEHVTDVFGNETTTPKLNFKLRFDGPKCVSSPSLSELCNEYCSFLDILNATLTKLPSFEHHLGLPASSMFLPHDYQKPFNLKAEKAEFTEQIIAVYEQLTVHLTTIENDFNTVVSENAYDDLSEQLQQCETYDHVLAILKAQLVYKSRAWAVLDRWNFYHGNVDQVGLKEQLNAMIDARMDQITEYTVNQQLAHHKTLHDEYDDMVSRALSVPSDTEAFLALGEYMLLVKTTFVGRMIDVTKQLSSTACQAAQFAELPADLWTAHAATVGRVRDIASVLSEYSAAYEIGKLVAEERLAAAIGQLHQDADAFAPSLTFLDRIDDLDKLSEYRPYFGALQRKIEQFDKTVVWINREEELLKKTISTFPELEEIKDFTMPFVDLINLAYEWTLKKNIWLHGDFDMLKYDEIDMAADHFYKEAMKMQKTFRVKCKEMIVLNSSKRYEGVIDDPNMNAWPAPLKIGHQVIESMKEFRKYIPMVGIMCNPSLTERHWDDMSELTGFDITPDAGTTLQKIIDFRLDQLLPQFDVISISATKEEQLRKTLHKMKDDWKTITLSTSPYKDTGIDILSGLDNVQTVLDDHIVKTITIRGSAFAKPMANEVREWYATVIRMNVTLEEWAKVQVQWLYLMPIFSSKDIVAQMPEEGALFHEIDVIVKGLLDMVNADPLAIKCVGQEGVLESLINCIEMMDTINAGVNDYLEKKRLYFTRFFFLSNDEMLEILSETKNPRKVQPHLKKCFEGIAKLGFNDDLDIIKFMSAEGEEIEMKQPVSTAEAHGSVEKWLLQVEDQMIASVQKSVDDARLEYPTVARTDWTQTWPGQCVLCVGQVNWTSDVHVALLAAVDRTESMREYHKILTGQLNDVVGLLRGGRLRKQARITLGALITLDVHCRDVVDELADSHVTNAADFKWLRQLRYYWEDDSVVVRITNATVGYAYEYLGNTPRLVVTPLTDRCYRTLISAYRLHLNGAPEGPAGTGKTETVKDLARALAVRCVVFNCSDGLDYLAMAKFFKGLASSGAWACFDEFNRIDVEVLSVVAQQILCVIQAVRAGQERFVFDGTELHLNPACYVCITMNPGYAGRSELPDNLKVLFRTVAMMVPDYAMIGEISLYSYGFVNARELSVKIVTTYKLCSEQLSSQSHYDYGMRAVKTVLIAAGNLKTKQPDGDETVLLLRSILDVNSAKFLNKDVPLFNGIVSDLFPGVKLPRPDYDDLINAAKLECSIMRLRPEDGFMEKLIQTYEMMIVRHGFMMVGHPLGGKTSLLHLLARTLCRQNELGQDEERVEYETVNPKALTMGQLYGCFDDVSHEWSDGVVANTFRQFSMADTPDRKWLIFDGPVDAVWIENMNTVLDDNKKLCLSSGEVIGMPDCMSMVFEVMDLTQASPATVSRCGMIYLDPSTLGWRPFVQIWMDERPEFWTSGQNGVDLMGLFDWLTPPCLYFVRRNCVRLTDAGETNTVLNVLNILEIQLKNAAAPLTTESKRVTVENTEFDENFTSYLQGSFIYASIWGFGGTLDARSRPVFDRFFRALWSGEVPGAEPPDSLSPSAVLVPNEGTLYDYVFQCAGKGSWKNMSEIAAGSKIEVASNIEQTLVHTLDTVRYTHLVDMFISHRKPLLLFGPTGTGKSFYIRNHMMNKLSLDEYVPSFITFTAETSANFTQEMITSKLIKRKRGVYGPPAGKVSVIFIDDMNMPVKEMYGAQPPIELLRQHLDHGHWYNLQDTTKVYVQDILLLTAIGPPGGSRQDVYARFLRHFGLFVINSFDDTSITKIFSSLLQIGLNRNGFTLEVVPVIEKLVLATVGLYRSAISNLAPTPAKSHYLFNLRDVSKVTNGILMFRKESYTDRRVFVRLWVHEVMRVFFDRLVDGKDREWLFNEIRDNVNNTLQEQFDTMFKDLSSSTPIVLQDMSNLLFTNALDMDAADDKKYEEPLALWKFRDMAQMAIDEYNSTHKSQLNIVLFEYAIQHLSRIGRVVSIPGGSALLVGVGGSGRQSLSRLAAAMCNYSVFQPEITKGYGLNEWREDLKAVLVEAGGKNRPTIFLFAEGQVKEEYFLQDIDALLNSGEVPNLFTLDEEQNVLEMVRLAAQGGNRNLDISPLVVFNYFIGQCKRNLHICLCFSPIGSTFRNRLRLYPSMVSCCTIDWFEDWPENALEMVAHKFLQNVNLSDKIKESAVIVCQRFHVDARKLSAEFYAITKRRTYITSASYLDLIQAYTDCTNRKQKEIMDMKKRYVVGLQELEKATVQVSQMKDDLFKLQPQLQLAQQDAESMMNIITRETAEVERATNLVEEDEKVANIQAEAANALRTECENDLALAIPILDEAINALNTLKPADITLVKSMKNPPDTVKTVMAAVCVMKDVPPDRIPNPSKPGQMMLDYWGPSKRLLGDLNFLQKLKDYDKDNIDPAVMATIRTVYLPNPRFRPAIVAKASSAAEGLCKWILALDMYDQAIRVVAPKKLKLEEANAEYEATAAVLEGKRAEVARLRERLDALQEQLAAAVLKKERLLAEVTLCESKLLKAEKLIGSLGGEKHRWALRASQLQDNYNCIPGDILVSCGIIAYLAPFTSHFRSSTIDEWKTLCTHLKIPSSVSYSLIDVLGVPVKIQNWTIDGLPMDSFSIDNAIIMDGSQRWSLLIDPQSQAHRWIKTMERSNDITIIRMTDSSYMKLIEVAIEVGKPVLIENVAEDLDAPLDPILLKQVYQQGKLMFIALGDNVIEYNPNFRLYITSKLRNPHYLPEIFNKVTVINFALTIAGLEDQLLGIVVAKERPDLDSKRQKLIVESAENAKSLLDVENNILQILSAPGNILEDENAVDILDNSKVLAQEILRKQASSVETVKVIDHFRLQYKPIAQHCSTLYYCITDLPNLDPMYQYSLTWFINIYIATIETAIKSKVIRIRLTALRDTFTYNLYSNVCRSLFEKDKTLFSFIMCTTIMLAEQKIDKQELMFLLTGGVGLKNDVPNPGSDWLLDKSWDEICRMDELAAFKGIRDDVARQPDAWRDYYDRETAALPAPWHDRLTEFQRIAVVRAVRPDRVVPVARALVASELGDRFVRPPPFDIGRSYDDSSCLTPLVFILSPGVDPMASLEQFAGKMGRADGRLHGVSLGQGQGPKAELLIQEARNTGDWVCLQNCHLATSWMGSLEAICDSFDMSNVNTDFRLWLTSYPSDQFPVSVLQNGVKMTNEPPTGLRENMLRSYWSYPVKDKEFYEGCPGKQRAFTKLLYGITFFHAVVQERRKYGPIGWNIPYGFNESDYHISIQQLQMYINEFDEIPFEAITYLTGECNYGGRVTDDWDRRTMNTILEIFCCRPVVTNPSYLFCDLDTKYGIPYGVVEHDEFIKHIEKLPEAPSPEVFGLHANAGIVRDLETTRQMLDSYASVAAEFGGGGATDDAAAADELLTAIASGVLAKLPNNFDVETVAIRYPVTYVESMNTVLVQEMERFNILLTAVRRSLRDVVEAVRGAAVMTPELETVARSLSAGKCPALWSRYSYPSLKSLGGYAADLVDRLHFLQIWYENGKPDNFWLSGFFFTQAFLTGVMQNFARRYAIPIDQLCFDFRVQRTDRIDSPPEDGVFCYGLFLDGARWDRTRMVLEEQLPKVLTDVLPLVWFVPIRKTDLIKGNRYTCPVYKTSERRGILSTTGHSTNYVLPMFLDTDKTPSHWTYRGVALLCQLND